MRDNPYQLRAGDVILITRGCYSDYCHEAHLAFRRDCDLERLADEWAKSIKDGVGELDCPSTQEFVAWLVVEGHAVAFDVGEIHVGDYSGVEIGRVQTGYDVEDWKLLPEEPTHD